MREHLADRLGIPDRGEDVRGYQPLEEVQPSLYVGGWMMLAVTDQRQKQLAQVMRATAIELDALRSVPAGMRRAVLGLANALRASMDPRIEAGDESAGPAPVKS